MSSFATDFQKAEVQQQQKGPEAFLSPEERKQLQRLLGHPTDYPKELGPWIREYLQVNPPDFAGGTAPGRGVRLLDVNKDSASGDSVNETVLYTGKIPAGALGTHGSLRLICSGLISCADGSNDVLFRVRLGGSSGTVLALFQVDTSTLDGTQRPWALVGNLYLLGAQSSQVFEASHHHVGSSGAVTTQTAGGFGSVDMGQDVEIVVTADWTSAGTQNLDKQFASMYATRVAG